MDPLPKIICVDYRFCLSIYRKNQDFSVYELSTIIKFSATDLIKCLSSRHGSKLFSSFSLHFFFALVSKFSSPELNRP